MPSHESLLACIGIVLIVRQILVWLRWESRIHVVLLFAGYIMSCMESTITGWLANGLIFGVWMAAIDMILMRVYSARRGGSLG